MEPVQTQSELIREMAAALIATHKCHDCAGMNGFLFDYDELEALAGDLDTGECTDE